MTIQLQTPSTNINVATFTGYFNVTKDIKGGLDLSAESHRCSLDLKNCEVYPGIVIRDMCKKFIEKNVFYTNFFENIRPPLKCPLKSGLYAMEETKFDFSFLSLLPIDGHVWLSNLKLLSAENIKRKRVVACINAETKILRIIPRKT